VHCFLHSVVSWCIFVDGSDFLSLVDFAGDHDGFGRCWVELTGSLCDGTFMTVVVDRFVDVVASSGITAGFSLHSYFSCFIVSGLSARKGNPF